MIVNEKRIRKTPTFFSDLYTIRKRISKSIIKQSQNKNRCHYEDIPLPAKYADIHDSLLLCANIPIVIKDGQFYTDLSLLNEFHIFRQINSTFYENEGQKQRVLNIITERRTDVTFSRWKSTSKNWMNHKKSEIRAWGRYIRDFCLTFEQLIGSHLGDLIRLKIEDDIQYTIAKLMSTLPFIKLKTHFRGFENRLAEIVVSEKLMNILGYTRETFVSTVLTEGLPQMIPFTFTENSLFLKNLLNEYFTRPQYNFQLNNLDTQLITKSGLVRKVKLEVHLNIIYEDDKHGCELLIFIKENTASEPVFGDGVDLDLRPDFVEMLSHKELELQKNLEEHYPDAKLAMKYSTLQRTCRIKDLI